MKVNVSILEGYADRNLNKYFRRQLAKAQKVLDKNQNYQFGSWRDEYELVSIEYNTLRSLQNALVHNPKEQELIQQADSLLNKGFLWEKLKLTCALFNRQSRGLKNPPLAFQGEVHSFATSCLQESRFIMRAYGYIYFMYEAQEAEPFFLKFQKELIAHKQELPSEEGKELFEYAFNYCIRKYILGDFHYTQILFQLYKSALSLGILLNPDGSLPLSHFQNLCVIGNKVGKWEHTRKIIKKYGPTLPTTSKTESVLAYCRAHHAFYRKKYSDCLHILQAVEMKDYLKIEVRTLMMKCYFELGETEALDSLMISFERWLQRNTQLESRRIEIQTGRIRILKKIQNLAPTDTEKALRIQEDIAALHHPDSHWLSQKLRERIPGPLPPKPKDHTLHPPE